MNLLTAYLDSVCSAARQVLYMLILAILTFGAAVLSAVAAAIGIVIGAVFLMAFGVAWLFGGSE